LSDDDKPDKRESETLIGGRLSGEPEAKGTEELPTLTFRFGPGAEEQPTKTHRGPVPAPAPAPAPSPRQEAATLTHWTTSNPQATERPTLTHMPPTALGERGSQSRISASIVDAPTQDFHEQAGPEIPAHQPTLKESLSDWKVGDVIDGKYEVREKLGQGGMGVVWRVHHRHWRIDLAVKIPTSRLVSNPQARQRFLLEAETWVALGVHPNIVQCWYVRELGGIPRLFLDHVAGGTLKDQMRAGAVTPGQWDKILDFCVQACDGLAHAHSQGVVHRDVKPANMLVAGDVLKVTDFGLVRLVSESEERPVGEVSAEAPRRGQTQMGAGLGTAEYGAPEQWLDARTADHRADIYALGMTLFELACGRRAFDDGSHDEPASTIIARHLSEPAPDPRSINPAVPEPLALLILRCLEKDPNKRPQTARDLRAELVKLHEAVVGKPLERIEPRAVDLRAEALNNRAVSMWDLGKQDQAYAAWKEALALDPAQLEAFFNKSLLDWRRGRVNADYILSRLREARVQHPFAGVYSAYFQLERLALEDATRELAEALADANVAEDAAAWRALGHALLAQEAAQDAAEAYGEALARAPFDEQATQGKALVDSGGYVLPDARVFPHPRLLFDGRMDGAVRRVAPSASGDALIAAVHMDGAARVMLWERSFDAPTMVLDVRPGVEAATLTPTGTFLASAGADGNVQLWNRAFGNCRRAFHEPGAGFRAVALTTDGRYMVTASGQAAPLVWDAAVVDLPGASPVARNEGHAAAPESMVALPEAPWIATGGPDGKVGLWDLTPGWLRGRALEAAGWLDGLGGAVLTLATSPDGKRLAAGSAAGTVKVYDLATRAALHTFSAGGVQVVALAFTPDGGRLLAGASDRTMRLYDLASGACTREIEGVEQNRDLFVLPGDIVVAHDGRRIVAIDLAADREILRAPLMCSRAREHHEEASHHGRFLELLEQARDAERQGNHRLALAFLGAARSVPGFERDPAVLELAGHLSSIVPRRSLIGCWLRRTIGQHPRPIRGISVSSDGQSLLTSSEDGTLRLWRVTEDAPVLVVPVGGGRTLAAALLPDGRTAATASEDGSVRIFDLSNGRCQRTIATRMRALSCATLAPDGTAVIAGAPTGEIVRFGLYGGERDPVASARSRAIAVGNDGWTVALATGAQVLVYKPGQPAPQVLTGHTGEVLAVAITPDGAAVLSASADNTVRSWDLGSGDQKQIFLGHDGPVESLVVTPDARFAFSGGRDGAIHLWELSQPISQRAIAEGSPSVVALALTPDGRYLISAAQQMKLWELDWEFLSHG
jgi:WD40 repeat protein/serine/threonine protein kinase